MACDGGGGPLGHPRIFINLDKPQICWCTYCGVPYVSNISIYSTLHLFAEMARESGQETETADVRKLYRPSNHTGNTSRLFPTTPTPLTLLAIQQRFPSTRATLASLLSSDERALERSAGLLHFSLSLYIDMNYMFHFQSVTLSRIYTLVVTKR